MLPASAFAQGSSSSFSQLAGAERGSSSRPTERGVFVPGNDEGLEDCAMRDPGSGSLTQTGCAEGEPTYKSCSETRGLYAGQGMAVSSDARSTTSSTVRERGRVFAASVAIASRTATARPRGRFSDRLAAAAGTGGF